MALYDFSNILKAQDPNYNWPPSNYFRVTADMSSATWNTAAAHTVATSTGMVRAMVIVECTATLTDAADGASIQLGVGGSTALYIGSTGAAGAGGSTIAQYTLWYDTGSRLQTATSSTVIIDKIMSGGLSLAYEITGAALTGGTLVFHVWWLPMNATGAMAAGTGA